MRYGMYTQNLNYGLLIVLGTILNQENKDVLNLNIIIRWWIRNSILDILFECTLARFGVTTKRETFRCA